MKMIGDLPDQEQWTILKRSGWRMGSSLRYSCRVCRKMISPSELAAYSPKLTPYHRGCLDKSPMAMKVIKAGRTRDEHDG